jgi:hypothetical protein
MENKMTQSIFELRNKVERMYLERLDTAKHRTETGCTPSSQYEAHCIARGIGMALEEIKKHIHYNSGKPTK